MRRAETIQARDLLGYAPVRQEIEGLREAVKGKHFSDLVDDQGNQYVDLVMEGGGMLGVALVGYVHALEEVGIRFLDLAGTSAGSITALLLAAVGDKDAPKSEKLLTALAQQNLSEFLDGNWGARSFSKLLMARRFKILRYPFGPFVAVPLRKHLGLHPGDEFEAWVSGILKECGMDSAKALCGHLKEKMEGIKHRDPTQTLGENDRECRLALIAAEVTTGLKVEFPKMAELFWDNPDSVNPASFVRASMSVPFFFRPLSVPSKPLAPKRKKQWQDLGVTLSTSNGADENTIHVFRFIDGGIMSNFPINIFHQDKVPNAPTFGVRLSRRKMTPVTQLNVLAKAIFDSARHALDTDFINQHPDYKYLVEYVDTTGFQWLNFGMKPLELQELFLRGVQAASAFLKRFNWDDAGRDGVKSYKSVRATLAREKQELGTDGLPGRTFGMELSLS
ncbi:alpha/beta hydrolase [Pyxidicoccus fallax]|uniref:Alpha/beta hydrolase n=1 Tax=Pyxidicoccus fallax TaxID=394095 RepID=A0A848LNI3_9BACT|nr:patatin-like phospholipase family protein [Pyxidicoccus fallax]NMO19230.1 alpha/beta hydrolase [Pyxidicoccus fallax]NPC80863.1 alpha/beta hydrolase [Pyxidicoccus fallax]